jgi:hypothetical protein
MTPIESRWKELSNGILVDILVKFLCPNHPFPLQNPGIAASNRFWPSPPRNSYHPQFGSASAMTIPLIHSWSGPSLSMVLTFSFEWIVHNCHQFDCIVTSHCTRTTFCKMTNSDDYIKLFRRHCSSTYNWLETAVPMVDIAIKHVKKLSLSHVSEKVKSDFFKILLGYSKANGNLVVFSIEPITACLLNLIEDDEFNVANFMTYHLSMPIDVPEQSSPLANLLEQGTLLTINLSEHTKKV